MNIAICDDNETDSQLIRHYLLEHFKQFCYTGDIHIFSHAAQLFNTFSPCFFDAYFLDIYMPGISGVEAARRIRRENPYCALIFITVSPDHMREAFSLRAASYVEKPITATQMEVAFTQCQGIFLKNARYIEVNCGRQNTPIPLTKIKYVELECRITLFHLISGEVFKTYKPLDEVEQGLGGEPFLRCHRSFLVNMNYVKDILDTDLLMQSGEKVPIRKNGRKDICYTINDFFSKRLFETACWGYVTG